MSFEAASQMGSAQTLLTPRPRADFVETDAVKGLTRRALGFLDAGFPLHLRGPAGTGKTTLALHIAAQLGRPTIVITGDNEMGTSDLVGTQHGYDYRKVVDRFIHNVTKFEETSNQRWSDHRLTTACREGYTLVYDEFTRSRPESHNVLLGVFEEKMLVLPAQSHDESYIRVHPNFRAILTSNPQEYAGVHPSQDALSDRLATIDIGHPDREMEILITTARSGLARLPASRIVDLVREFRESGEYGQTPTMRASLMIARVAARGAMTPSVEDKDFVQLCIDVLGSRAAAGERLAPAEFDRRRGVLLALIALHCPPPPRVGAPRLAAVADIVGDAAR
jgi:gas vesicle protein GvpN